MLHAKWTVCSFTHLMTEANDVKTSLNFFKLAPVSQRAHQVLKVSSSCLEVAGQETKTEKKFRARS